MIKKKLVIFRRRHSIINNNNNNIVDHNIILYSWYIIRLKRGRIYSYALFTIEISNIGTLLCVYYMDPTIIILLFSTTPPKIYCRMAIVIILSVYNRIKYIILLTANVTSVYLRVIVENKPCFVKSLWH